MNSNIEFEKIQRLLEDACSTIESDNPTASCLVGEFVNQIAGERCWRAIPYFHEHAPQVILDEAIFHLKQIKDEYGFLFPGVVINPRNEDQCEQDALANRPLFTEMYRVFVLGEAPDSSHQ